MVKFLIAKGANPDIGDLGDFPLEQAMGRANPMNSDTFLEMIKLLLELGADPSGGTVLNSATQVTRRLRYEIFTQLLRAGADVNKVVVTPNSSKYYCSPGIYFLFYFNFIFSYLFLLFYSSEDQFWRQQEQATSRCSKASRKYFIGPRYPLTLCLQQRG